MIDTLPAALYARISLDPQGLRAGVDRQEEDCRREIARRGWTLAPEHVYVDNDVSAYSGKRRPAYAAMLAAVEAGDVRAIVTWAPDRLTRYLPELESLVTLIERTGCQIATVQGGDWDLTTPEGRFMARQLGLLARLEAEKTGARVARARRAGAEAGRPSPGSKAWGFKADRITHEPAEVEAIRDIARRLLGGQSLRSASLMHGKDPKDVKRAILSPRMVGIREYKGQQYQAVWEPVLDRDTWEALRAMLNARNRDTVSGVAARKYLLTGFLYCGVCGDRCQGFRRGKWLKYCCHPHGCVVRSTPRLDDHVRDQLLLRHEVPASEATIDPALTGAVAALEVRRNELQSALSDPTAPVAALLAAIREVEARLLNAQERLVEAVAVSLPPAGGIHQVEPPTWQRFGTEVVELVEGDYGRRRAWWAAADLRQKRVLLGDHVSRIIVHKNKVPRLFEPESVEILGTDGARWDVLEVPARVIADADIAAEVAERYAQEGLPGRPDFT